jgi:Kef-type K+ transport systems, membrane components
MNAKTIFESLFIICTIAFGLPVIIHKIKIFQFPVIIAEILSGIIIGRSGLNLVRTDPVLEFLSLLGFAYLMFLSGLEIDFLSLKHMYSYPSTANPVQAGIIIFLLTMILSFFFAGMLQKIGIANNALFLTLIFATTSLGIVIPTLQSRGISQKPIGQLILVAALFADFGTMLLIPVAIFFISGEKTIDFVYTGLILGGAVLIFFIGKKRLFGIGSNSSSKTSQMMVRGSFALIFIFVALAEMANIEIILGAFIAGVLYAFLFRACLNEVRPKLEAVGYGFLIPIFFMMIGVTFNLKTLVTPQIYLLLPLLLYIAYIVKLIPALVLRKYYGWRETLGAGFLLSSRLSLIIGISFIALKEGMITPSIHATFVLVAMITCLISPLIFMQVFPHDGSN